jgi:hypothetical protein
MYTAFAVPLNRDKKTSSLMASSPSLGCDPNRILVPNVDFFKGGGQVGQPDVRTLLPRYNVAEARNAIARD